MHVKALILSCVIGLGVTALASGTAVAEPRPCPRAYFGPWDYPQLEAFVLGAGGDPSLGLEPYFDHIDANEDGYACFKTLPAATPLPTPPLLGHDNRL